MREGSLYTERSLQFIGKTYQYALGKWIISDHESKEGKILTISKLRPYVRKHILEENEKFDEESDKLLGVLKINTVLMSRMLGASHIHIFNYNECKQNIEIMSEIEEADDESELFYDVHMTYEEYKAFCAIEEQLSIEELEKRIHCTPLNKWRSQGIVSIRKCPIIFAGDCLGCILITYDHVTEDDFKERQMLSKMIDDVAFLIKNIELYKKVKVELRKTQIAENELRECLNIASDVPMILNRQGDFVRIGKACESILGWKQDEVIGKNIHHFDKSDVIDKIHDIVKQIQETNTLSQGIQKVCIKNGENKWLEWRGKYSEDKSLIHIALRDITEEKEKELERIAYKDALRVENLKNEFVTNISHELKTPVNVVYSTLQLVELELMEMEDELCEVDRERWYKLKKYHHTTRQNVFRLIRLINNITDISEIDAGAYKMKLENYDIVQVIGSIVQATTEYVKSREIRLCTDLDDEEVIVAIDAEKFERVMLNLISNAVKFSSEGCKILIEVAKENEELFIKMSDNGIGIPKEKLGMIFDKFTQVDNIYTRKHEGTGIGLAVVREMLQLMQGEISVESEENEGSSFTIKLPIRKLEGKGVQFFGEKEKRILNCQSQLSDIYGI